MTKQILDTLRVVSPNVPFGHESGKALKLLEFAKKTDNKLPMNAALQRRIEAVEASVPYAKDKWKALFGEAHRTDSLLSFYVEDALTRQMSKDAESHIPYLIELGREMAEETMQSTESRKTHPAIGNPLFTHNILLPIGWLAWKSDKKTALLIWKACLYTKSISFIPGMLWGVIAYTWRAKHPPAFVILAPLLPILAVTFLLKRMSRGWFNPLRWKLWRRPRMKNLLVLREVKKSGKIYGYGGYTYALEDHFEVYNRAKEHWSDAPHWYWRELKATLPDSKPVWDCYIKHIKNASPEVAGALGAHMGCLSTLFRTSATSIIESFLFALSMNASFDAPNNFHTFYEEKKREINTRNQAWVNNTILINSMLKDDSSAGANGAFDLREPIFFEGEMYVPKDLSEENLQALKRAYEKFIAFRGPLQHLRYLWLLWGMNDPDQTKWLGVAMRLSPKRMRLEIEQNPFIGKGVWVA